MKAKTVPFTQEKCLLVNSILQCLIVGSQVETFTFLTWRNFVVPQGENFFSQGVDLFSLSPLQLALKEIIANDILIGKDTLGLPQILTYF